MNKKSEWNAAAYIAALKGDLANAAIASTPGGIEAQEARGQRDFVASETLPKEGLEDEICERLGIKVLGDHDDLFYSVQLPTGWTKRATDHSMWTHLLDDKGRRRASMFYKAAFYDRAAHISFNTRYCPRKRPINGWKDSQNDDPRVGVIEDIDTEIWVSEPIDRKDYDKPYELAKAKLDEMYPNWCNIYAYWNDDATPATTDAANDAHSAHDNGNEDSHD